MQPSPLGQICVSLGLLSEEGVQLTLDRLAVSPGGRFGEVALSLGLLDEGGLAAALAVQFQGVALSEAQVARLSVPAAVLDLLPPQLLRDRAVLPVYLDPDARALSLLTADPADVPTLRTAARFARASQIRLLVGPKSAVRALVARLIPESGARGTGPRTPVPSEEPPGAVVLEPDPDRLAALRRLEALEGGKSELVQDPDQVTALLEAGLGDRVFYRAALAPMVAPYAAAWQRSRPGVQLLAEEGFSASFRPAMPYGRSRDFFLDLQQFLLLAGETRNLTARRQMRRTVTLTAEVAARLDLRPEQRDALALAALFVDLDAFALLTGLGWETTAGGPVRLFGLALTALQQLHCPFPVEPLFRGLERRTVRVGEPSYDLATEVLFSVRAAVRARVDEQGALDGWGERGELRHHPQVLPALQSALRRRRLLGGLATGGRDNHRLLIVEGEPAVLATLEMQMSADGFDVRVGVRGDLPLEALRREPPLAVIAGLRLPGRDGLSLLDEPALGAAPVLLLADPTDLVGRQAALDRGAAAVLPRPVLLPDLRAALRGALDRAPGEPTPLRGEVGDLSLEELLRRLVADQRTATARIGEGEDAARISLQDGQILEARCGDQPGPTALASALAHSRGAWRLRFGEGPAAPNLSGDPRRLISSALQGR